MSGLQADLSGILGRRTKYQSFDTAQLVLLAQSSTDQSNASAATASGENDKKEHQFSTELKDEDLEAIDDIRLRHVKLLESDANTKLTEVNLDIVDQCILLTLW